MSSTTVSELDQAGLIAFAGEDTQVFLSNLLTCDVAALAMDRSTYGAYCTPKGRVLASFLLWRTERGFFMQLPASLREPIQKQLSKFILRSKVRATDASADWRIIGVAGKDAGTHVQRAVGQAPGRVHDVAGSPDAMVIKLSGERYEILAARDKAPRFPESSTGAEKGGAARWEWLDIRAGIPTILPATQEAFVPQMLNLDLIGGVSFEKGCYPGQEIVARMRYRGTLKQRMYLASIPSEDRPQPGDKLYSPAFGEQACGTVVNAAPSPEGGHDALAVIQITSAEQGGVHWKSPNGAALKLLALPYPVPAVD